MCVVADSSQNILCGQATVKEAWRTVEIKCTKITQQVDSSLKMNHTSILIMDIGRSLEGEGGLCWGRFTWEGCRSHAECYGELHGFTLIWAIPLTLILLQGWLWAKVLCYRENGVSARRLTASRRVKHEDHKTENVISWHLAMCEEPQLSRDKNRSDTSFRRTPTEEKKSCRPSQRNMNINRRDKEIYNPTDIIKNDKLQRQVPTFTPRWA